MTFHQCVNLGRFNTEKVVSFVPPDGEFDLMKYRCQEGISLPFRVLPIINEMGRTRMEVGQEACQGWNVAVHLRCSKRCSALSAGAGQPAELQAAVLLPGPPFMTLGCTLAEVNDACLSRCNAVAQLLAGNDVVQQPQRSLASEAATEGSACWCSLCSVLHGGWACVAAGPMSCTPVAGAQPWPALLCLALDDVMGCMPLAME